MDFIRFFDLSKAETVQDWIKKTVRLLNSLASRIQGSVSEGIEGLETQVGKLNTVVDLTSASSDYELSVNETAKITITAASTPLNIAVEDGVYELHMEFDATSFAADQAVQLDINNTTYVGTVAFVGLEANTAIATDEVDARDAGVDGHRFYPASLVRPQTACGRLIITSANSGTTSLMSEARGRSVAGLNYIFHISTRMTGTPHTSLGTLQVGEVATGVCYVKRIA
jgi:hypothetical protein